MKGRRIDSHRMAKPGDRIKVGPHMLNYCEYIELIRVVGNRGTGYRVTEADLETARRRIEARGESTTRTEATQ